MASAYLDDEVTTEERARVEADPALLARVEELRSVHDALSDPVVPPTSAERDAAIRAALGAHNVIDISAARGQRRLRIASIAAAVVLVLGAAGALIRAADDGSTQRFNTAAGSIGSASDSRTAERAARPPERPTGSAPARSRPVAGRRSARSRTGPRSPPLPRRRYTTPRYQSTQAGRRHAVGAHGRLAADDHTDVPRALSRRCDEGSKPARSFSKDRRQVDVFTIADGSLVLVVTDAASCAQVFTQPV